MAKLKKKNGRPTKITPEVRKQVYSCLEIGGSICDAADVLEITRRTLYNHMRDDPSFYTGTRKAIKKGKNRLLAKMGKAKQWQAAAWMLERRWGKEFGRNHKVELTGANGGPVKTEGEVKHVVDYDKLREDLERLAGDRSVAGRIPANGNGKPVHSGDPN